MRAARPHPHNTWWPSAVTDDASRTPRDSRHDRMRECPENRAGSVVNGAAQSGGRAVDSGRSRQGRASCFPHSPYTLRSETTRARALRSQPILGRRRRTHLGCGRRRSVRSGRAPGRQQRGGVQSATGVARSNADRHCSTRHCHRYIKCADWQHDRERGLAQRISDHRHQQQRGLGRSSERPHVGRSQPSQLLTA